MNPKPHSSHTARQEVQVTASEYQFSSEQIEVSVHDEVTFNLVNQGTDEHYFNIKGRDDALHALPGHSDSRTFVFNEPGLFEAVCTLPGHQAAGMITTILVTE